MIVCQLDLNAYLERIGYSGPLEPTETTLRELHRSHLLAVPFENLDIHIGRAIELDERRFFEKVVLQRRGGFCYELNGLFAALLRRLGFRVTLLSAGVARETGGFGPEFDHMTLLVHLEQPWLADVGFGECFRDPLPLAESQSGAYRLENAGGRWTLWRGSAPQYAFSLDAREMGDFAGMCLHHQTSPESSFTRGRICTLATADGRVTLSGEKLIVAEGDCRTVRILEPEDCCRALVDQFGIVIPREPYLRGLAAAE